MKRFLSILVLVALLPCRVGADLTATVQPGYVFAPGETPTTSTLNQLGQPTITVAGTVTGTAGLAAGTVTGNLLANSVPDGITLDYNGSNPRQLEVKSAGIGVNQISATIAGNGLTGGSGSALSVVQSVLNADPVGSVIMYAGSTPPTGWLECNGAAVSRTTYATLFTVCSTTFGSGDGSTTFNLPQLQGNFVRGWANTETTNDTGRVFGSWQQQTNAPHQHWIANTDTLSYPAAEPTANNYTVVNTAGSGAPYQSYTLGGDSTVPTIGLTSVSGNTESRPNNVALMYIIKWQ